MRDKGQDWHLGNSFSFVFLEKDGNGDILTKMVAFFFLEGVCLFWSISDASAKMLGESLVLLILRKRFLLKVLF